jgi:predicted enzyme related to lactoylglutathione lyase
MAGKLVHIEFPAQDVDRGTQFYSHLLDTDDIDASVARVRELGGQADDKQPIPHVGWFARCTDTEGNPFSFFQSDESAAPPHG